MVSGLIDGAGSLGTPSLHADWSTHRSPCLLSGATLGPFIAGTLPSWTYLFYLLMGAAFTAAIVRLIPCHTNMPLLITYATVFDAPGNQGIQGASSYGPVRVLRGSSPAQPR